MEKLYSAISTSNADIATADYYEDNKGNLKEISHLGKNIQCDTLELKRKILLNGCRLWTSIFKRKLIFDNNLFFPEGVIYEDNAVGPALFLSAKKIRKIDDNIYYYRKNAESTTNRINDYRFFDRLETSILAFDNIHKIPNYQSELIYLKEEIDWLFIRLYLINTLIGTIKNFDPIPTQYIKYVVCNIKRLIDKWYTNKYYNKMSIKYKTFVIILKIIPTPISKLINFYRKIRKRT